MKTLLLLSLSSVFLFTGTIRAETKVDATVGIQFKKLSIESSPTWSGESATMIIQPNLKSRFSSRHSLRMSPSFRIDSLTKEETEKYQLTWNDTYFDLKSAKASLRFGFQNIVWEGTDFSNPLDLIMQKNLADPLEGSPLSSPGFGYLYETGPLQFDFYFIPEMIPSRLPGAKNPWWPRSKRLFLETEKYSLVVPKSLEYEISPAVEINHARSNNWGGRLQFKSETLDASIALFSGLSNAPYIDLDLLQTTLVSINPNVLLVTSPVRLRPLYFRSQSVGALFVIPFKGNLFKVGGNSIQPQQDHPSVPGSSTSQVLAWEKNFDLRRGPLTSIIQYHQSQTPQNGQLANFQSIFTRAATAGIRMPLSEDTNVVIGFIYDLIGYSSLSKAELTTRVTEGYEVGFGATNIHGSTETLLGIYDSYDSFMLRLTGYF